MNSYNGFTSHRRMKAYRWLMAEYEAGRRTRPISCDGCGQNQGLIEPHSEDYSEPYGDHIGQFGVCYVCHMIIHCRFKAPERWQLYCEQMRAGAIFKPFANKNFRGFAAAFLADKPLPPPDRFHPNPGSCTLLAQIASAAAAQ